MKSMIYTSKSGKWKLKSVEKVFVLVADFACGVEFFIESRVVDVKLVRRDTDNRAWSLLVDWKSEEWCSDVKMKGNSDEKKRNPLVRNNNEESWTSGIQIGRKKLFQEEPISITSGDTRQNATQSYYGVETIGKIQTTYHKSYVAL